MDHNNETLEPLLCDTRQKGLNLRSLLIDGVLTDSLIIFGLCGNIYCIKTIYGRSRWSSFLVLLFSWDILLLCSTLGFYGVVALGGKGMPWTGPHTYFYLFFYPLINLSMTGSLWTILLISIERYLALAYPFRRRFSPKSLCICLVACAIVVSSPAVLELRLVDCWNSVKQDWLPQIAQTALRLDYTYILIYRVICYFLFFSPLPFLVILSLTVKIMLLRRHAYRHVDQVGLLRRNTIRRRTASDRTAALLTSMVFKFLLCYSGPTLMNILEFVDRDIVFYKSYAYFSQINNLLVVAQSATNWLIYFKWKRRKPRRQRHTTVTAASHQFLDQEKFHEMGAQILNQLLSRNPDWQQHFVPGPAKLLLSTTDCDQSESVVVWHTNSYKKKRKCTVVSQLLYEVGNLIKDDNVTEAKEKLRLAGAAHTAAGVRFQYSDWMILKETIERNLGADPQTAQLVNLVISEMKIGGLCKAVEQTQSGILC